MEKLDDFLDDDEVRYQLTEWGCLSMTLADYGINTSHITGTIGKHLVDDFMKAMENAGYVERHEE